MKEKKKCKSETHEKFRPDDENSVQTTALSNENDSRLFSILLYHRIGYMCLCYYEVSYVQDVVQHDILVPH